MISLLVVVGQWSFYCWLLLLLLMLLLAEPHEQDAHCHPRLTNKLEMCNLSDDSLQIKLIAFQVEDEKAEKKK